MNKTIYYDGTRLLKSRDLNGHRPEIYICTSNRNAGKTTFFSKFLVDNWVKDHDNHFLLLYRYNYELEGVAKAFFGEIGELFFPNLHMTETPMEKGIYTELRINKEVCGYAVDLGHAEKYKKISHIFHNCKYGYMDEFQSEDNKYLKDEVTKIMSIHTSVARGKGKQIRRVPFIFIGNNISLLNPLYTALGISTRIRRDTRFLRGEGWVMEHGYNESAAVAQEYSAFNRAFKNKKYVQYASSGTYLNDSYEFIEKPSGRGVYDCTLKYNGMQYGILYYEDAGLYYVSTTVNEYYPIKLAITLEDFSINYSMLRRYSFTVNDYRAVFEAGGFRFQNLECKEALLALISYR